MLLQENKQQRGRVMQPDVKQNYFYNQEVDDFPIPAYLEVFYSFYIGAMRQLLQRFIY